ncbi:MAG: HAD hydrolase family protein, partial [Anaerolineae bacterium]
DATALVPYEASGARPFTKIIAWHEVLDLTRAYGELVSRYGAQARFYLTDGGHALQVTAAEATKGQGLIRLLAHLGIDPAAAVSFGDSTPDVEMFRVTGTSVAMGNALPEVQAAATLVAETHDDDGVAQIIERLLES